MAGSFATATVQAQPGGHPHIAPLAPGVDLLSPVRKVSPFLNYPDGSWNLGESTEGVDKGGALGADPTSLSTPTFVPLLGGWNAHPQPSLQRYVGSFRRPTGSGPYDETRASFELATAATARRAPSRAAPTRPSSRSPTSQATAKAPGSATTSRSR